MSYTPSFEGWASFYPTNLQAFPAIAYPIQYSLNYQPSYNSFIPVNQPFYIPQQNFSVQQPEPLQQQKTQDKIEKNKQEIVKKQAPKKPLKKEKDLRRLRDKTQSCKCAKTGCMKQYCFCYRAGQPCGESCGCKFCKNTINHNLYRPQKKKQGEIKCSCKKSHCSQKYCQCYLAGVNCGKHCNCNQCQN